MGRNGKGSVQRPCDRRRWEEGYDRVFRGRDGGQEPRTPRNGPETPIGN